MIRLVLRSGLALLAFAVPTWALTPQAREFIEIAKQLEPVHCQKRQLRRQIIMAEVENRDGDARELKKRFAGLDRNPETAKMEKRLAELERRISDGKGGVHDPEDLQAINFQRREAFYRCD